MTKAIASVSGLCVLAAAGISTSPLMRAQSPAARPEFEVASVKLNTTGCANGRGGGGAPPSGRISVTCIAMKDLIQAAYGTFANGPNMNPGTLQVLGAPGWVDSDSYDIEAKPAGNATVDQMYGPMLQVLLEDRFKLKIHRETRELPVYVLTVAKSGNKLQASREGSCLSLDPSHPPTQPQPGQPPISFCGRTSIRRNGAKMTVDAFGIGMALFAGTTLSVRLDLDRPVIDKTGLQGIFDLHLEFGAPNSLPVGAAADMSPSIFTALQEQLGLKLSPDKGPVDVLVVDHVERPSEN
jgi:uncharacterized protein (TIGR03435 family)